MRLNDLQKIEICNLFETGNYTFKKLADMYNISSSAIAGLLKRRGYSSLGSSKANRKYNINDNFFKKINTEEKAYFLGWIYSDGNITLNKYGGMLTIAINEEDEEILQKLKNAINYTGPLLKRVRNKTWKGSYINSKDSTVLQITNKTIITDLQKLGVYPAKSFILKFPTEEQVPKYLLPHFIRGYMDGDGSIYKKRKNYWILGFDGTKEFLQELFKYFQSINPTVKSKLQKRHKDKLVNSYNMKYNINPNLDLINLIYKNATIYLNRKYVKYNEAIAHIKECELREIP